MRHRTLALAVLLALSLSALTACGSAGTEDADWGHPTLIAHAGGAIYGFRYTNSLEALDASYAAGCRFIELDFQRTMDGRLVLIHDWDSMADRMLGYTGQRTHRAFMNSATFQSLTVMDLDTLLTWLKKHPDANIITDVKSANAEALRAIRDQAGEDAGRFIPQIYSYDQYDQVRALGYERIILTLYRMEVDPAALQNFVRTKQPWAVTVPKEILTVELLDAIHGAGTDTAVYCHTINDLSYYENWQPLGLSGIYTDYFSPDQWPYPVRLEDVDAQSENP